MEIEISNIKKSYKKRIILKNINLTAKSGEIIGIIGANGSGKSTLLSILSNTLKCDDGDFSIDGKSLLTNYKLCSETVGYVPQRTPLIDELSAKDNLMFWYNKYDLIEEIKNGIVKKLGVDKYLNLPVHKMSGGMKRRLAICCAVINKPKVLLLDEPTAALDIVCKQIIIDYLNAFKDSGGIVIMTTHNIDEFVWCDSLYVLKDGILKPYVYNSDINFLIEELRQ